MSLPSCVVDIAMLLLQTILFSLHEYETVLLTVK